MKLFSHHQTPTDDDYLHLIEEEAAADAAPHFHEPPEIDAREPEPRVITDQIPITVLQLVSR